jgi:hypothetical protein
MNNIEDIAIKFPKSTKVIGIVSYHAPFGFFLDIGIENVRGLVQTPTWYKVFPNRLFPNIGEKLEGEVLDIVDSSEIEIRILPISLF